MTRMLKPIFRISKYLLILAIIIIAIASVSLRFINPTLTNYKDDFEQSLSLAFNTPVKIDNVKASWYGIRPKILLQGINFPENPNQQILKIDGFEVYIDTLASLLKRKIEHSQIGITGLDIAINLPNPVDNNISPLEINPKLQDVFTELFTQERIIVKDSLLRVISADKTINLKITKLHLANEGILHNLVGVVSYGDIINTDFNFKIKAVGDKLNKLSLIFYANANSLNSNSDFAKDFTNKYKLSYQDLSLDFWLYATDGKLKDINLETKAYKLALLNKTKTITLSNLAARSSLSIKNNNTYKIKTIIDKANFNDLPLETTFVEYTDKISEKLVKANSIDLEILDSVLINFAPSLPRVKELDKLNLRGQVKNLVLRVPENHLEYAIKFDFSDLGFDSFDNFPAFVGLSGTIIANDKNAKILLQSDDLLVNFPSIWQNPIRTHNFVANINYQEELDGFKLNIPEVSGDLDSLEYDLSAAYDSKDNYLEFLGRSVDGDVKRLKPMIPTHILDKHLDKWLENSLLSGDIREAKFILNGKLDNFPFANKAGSFLGEVLVDNVNLKFDPKWPNIDAIVAKLNFKNDSLEVLADSGHINGSKMHFAKAVISKMGTNDVNLNVVGKASGDLKDGITYLKLSPYKNIGDELFNVELTGDFALDLDLDIPLATALGGKVLGIVDVKDGELTIPMLHDKLSAINTKFKFTENGFFADDFSAIFLAKPINIAIDTKRETIQINANQRFAIADLQEKYKSPFLEYVTGVTDVLAQVNIPLNDDKPFFTLNSNLQGVAINLPYPFGKTSDEQKDFSLNHALENSDTLYNIKLGEQVSANIIPLKGDKIAGVIHLGVGLPSHPQESGIAITGSVDKIDIDEYLDFAKTVENTKSSLNTVDLKTNTLKIAKQSFYNSAIRVDFDTKDLLVNLKGPELSGAIKVPKSHDSPVEVNFDRIFLKKIATKSKPNFSKVDIEHKLINIYCKDLRFANNRLGALSLNAKVSPQIIDFSNIKLNNSNFTFSGNGHLHNSNNPSTRLTGKVATNNLGRLLANLGKSQAIDDGKGEINFNLSWPGTPGDFALKDAFGKVDLNFKDGTLESVNPGLGRLLNVLSIANLPRRLRLDFKDITSNGFVFDKLSGNFNLQSGIARTNNTSIDGPSAKMNIAGKIGLLSESLDLDILVYPNVTGSLPLAAAIAAGNPAVGAAVWFMDKLISPQLDKLSEFHYKVSGKWSSPNYNLVEKNE